MIQIKELIGYPSLKYHLDNGLTLSEHVYRYSSDAFIQLFKEAREYENPGFQWTRRIIALTAVFAIVLFPKLLPLLQPDASVIVGYLEFKPGFLFIPEKEIMKWITLSSNSLVITPLDTNLVSAIIGLYFGGSLVKK